MRTFFSYSERGHIPRSLFWFALLTILLLFDQIIKYLVFYSFESRTDTVSIGISQFKNFQFAFSLPVPQSLMYTLYAAVLFGILTYLRKTWVSLSFWNWFAWILILAGALSNIGERIALGDVRDFIHFFWGYFNFADVYIVVGVIILLFGLDRQRK